MWHTRRRSMSDPPPEYRRRDPSSSPPPSVPSTPPPPPSPTPSPPRLRLPADDVFLAQPHGDAATVSASSQVGILRPARGPPVSTRVRSAVPTLPPPTSGEWLAWGGLQRNSVSGAHEPPSNTAPTPVAQPVEDRETQSPPAVAREEQSASPASSGTAPSHAVPNLGTIGVGQGFSYEVYKRLCGLSSEELQQLYQDMSNPRHQPGRPLTPAEMNNFLAIRAAHDKPIAPDEQAGIRAVYRRIALLDERDDDRRTGNLHVHFLPDATERDEAWKWSVEDLDITATVLDRQTDSLTFIVSLRPEYDGTSVNPANIKTFVHIPRSLMHGGALRREYEGLDSLLKEMIFDVIGYDHVARFHCRLASAGLWTGQPRPLPISPHAPRRRVLSSPAAPARTPTAPTRRQPPSSPSPAPRTVRFAAPLAAPPTRAQQATAAPLVVRGERVPAGVAASHPALRARVVPPEALENYIPHSTCAVCAVTRDLAALALTADISARRIDSSGKSAILAAPEKGRLDYARCPFLFAELGLHSTDEQAIIQAAKAFPDDELYAALVAMGVCTFHACRIVETVIADRVMGHEIMTFGSGDS